MDQQIAVAIVKPIAVKIEVAAQMAQVSRVTIYQWIKQGRLTTVKVGADQRVLVEEFERFLREGRGATDLGPFIRANHSWETARLG